MRVISLTPGTMGLTTLAIELVGEGNVISGGWGSAVYIRTSGLAPEDVKAAIDLIQERGKERGVEITATEKELP